MINMISKLLILGPYSITILNRFPKKQILDSSKLKDFLGENFKLYKNCSLLKRGKNTGKRNCS